MKRYWTKIGLMKRGVQIQTWILGDECEFEINVNLEKNTNSETNVNREILKGEFLENANFETL